MGGEEGKRDWEGRRMRRGGGMGGKEDGKDEEGEY